MIKNSLGHYVKKKIQCKTLVDNQSPPDLSEQQRHHLISKFDNNVNYQQF